MPRYVVNRTRRIDENEMNHIIRRCPIPQHCAILSILYIIGCRVSELIDLQKRDFNIKEDMITISVFTAKQRSISPMQPRRMLDIDINTPFISYVINYVQSLRYPEDVLFPIIRQKINRILKLYDENLCPHLFRHNRLQSLADAGLTANQLQAFAGWKNLSSSESYVRMSKKLSHAAWNKIR